MGVILWGRGLPAAISTGVTSYPFSTSPLDGEMQRRPARPCGHLSGIDVSVALVRLAICIGSRPACNADPLPSSGLPAVVAVEVSVRTGPIPKELRGLIRRMARENSAWGQVRIANELLLKLGLRVSPRTVGKYMLRPASGGRAEINDDRPLFAIMHGPSSVISVSR